MRMVKEFIANFRRFRMAGVLNIVGLSVAFAAFSVIAIQLVFELGYDRFHQHADRMFRVEPLYPMSLDYVASGPDPMGALLKADCPLIENYFHITDGGNEVFSLKDKNRDNKFKEVLVEATPSMVDMVDIKVLEGDGRQALTEPDMLMIPEGIARKWFPDGGATGKQVYVGKEKVYTVAAVYKELPENSVFTNCCYTRFVESDDWSNWNGQLFVLATTGDRERLNSEINGVKMEAMDQVFEGVQMKEQMEKERKSYLRVSPVTGIYYDNTVIYDTMKKGSKRSSLIMLAVGVLIVVIAGINFINFSMSQAPARMRGINTQKVLGATVVFLRYKLIMEAVLYSVMAFLVSVGLIHLVSLTSVSHLFTVSLSPLSHLPLLSAVGGLAVLIGFLAGLYPAFYVTSFEPALVLKGSFVMTPKGIRLRNGLMAFQFIISIVLITCTLLMGAQNRFMQNYSPGYSTENIGYFRIDQSLVENVEVFGSEMSAVTGVLDYTFSDNAPGGDLISATGTQIDGEPVRFDFWRVSKNFMEFFEIPLVKGDNFSTYNQEKTQVVFNETAIKRYPVLDHYFGRPIPNGLDSGRYVGVAKDIHYLSLRKPVDALALICSKQNPCNCMFLKLSGVDVAQTLDGVRKVYNKLMPEGMFEFRFLDESLQKQYESEQRTTQAISLLGGIAILLALVGVYGLVVFNAQYRRKEIGVRKVNGATEGQIIVLLNRSFFRLLIISFIIACPLAWYAVARWLEGFSYKTPIHWWIFLLAGVITFLIALITVSWQSWKAATDNPVKALKAD